MCAPLLVLACYEMTCPAEPVLEARHGRAEGYPGHHEGGSRQDVCGICQVLLDPGVDPEPLGYNLLQSSYVDYDGPSQTPKAAEAA